MGTYLVRVKKERTHFEPLVNLNFANSGETFEHSEGLLKKFTQRVLYLDQVRQKKERQVRQVAYTVAAGVAMIASILLTILLVSRFQQNSLPFIVGVIVVYMAKDRLKWLFQWISKKTIRIFY